MPETGSQAWWAGPGGLGAGGSASTGRDPRGLWKAGSRLPRLVTEEVSETLPLTWEKARVHAADRATSQGAPSGPWELGSVHEQQERCGERRGPSAAQVRGVRAARPPAGSPRGRVQGAA